MMTVNANEPVHLIARKGRMVLDLVNLTIEEAMQEAMDCDTFRILPMSANLNEQRQAMKEVSK